MTIEPLFKQLKPTCVSILTHASLSKGSPAELVKHLSQLQQQIQEPIHDPNLSQYIFFPLNQILALNDLDILHKHQSVLSSTFSVIYTLFTRGCGTLPPETLKQLWFVCILVIAGPMGNAEASLAKLRWSEDTLLIVTQTLGAVLKMLSNVTIKDGPILAHTLTGLLDQAVDHKRTPDLQMVILDALSTLTTLYPDQEIAARFLPGTVSSLCKIMLASPTPRSDVLVRSLQLLEDVLKKTIGNVACKSLVAPSARVMIDRLEDLGPNMLSDASLQGAQDVKDSDAGSESYQSAAWLRATTQQVHLALETLFSAIQGHPQPSVRVAVVQLSRNLLLDASYTLQPSTVELLLQALFILSKDAWDDVATRATTSLVSLLTDQPDLQVTSTELMVNNLLALPQAIMSQTEAVLSACLAILGATATILCIIPGVRVPRLRHEKWAWTLLVALEFATIPSLQSPADSKSGWRMLTWDKQHLWPELCLRHLSDTVLQLRLEETIKALATFSDADQALLPYFMQIARSNANSAFRASAWYLVTLMMEASTSLLFTSDVIDAFLGMQDAFDALFAQPMTQQGPSSEQHGLELFKPVKTNDLTVLPYLNRFDKTSDSNRLRQMQLANLSNTILCSCLALRSVARCSALQKTGFRAAFLDVLYPVLADLSPSSSHFLLQEYAQVALKQIALHTGYPSVQIMLLENADYLLNSISRGLLPSRLDLRAPAVLRAVIKLCGPDIVAYIQDVMDDIFDTLDQLHEYDSLCSALLGVLDTLIQTLAQDSAVDTNAEAAVLTSHKGLYPIADFEANLQEFATWYHKRRNSTQNQHMDDDKDDLPPPPGHRPGLHDFQADLDVESQEPKTFPEEAVIPLTRAESLASAILDKSVYFLSHPSPFLRSKMLTLVSSCVPLLASRETNILPPVNKAWPIICNRLDVSEPLPVTAEAANLIQTLALHFGEFLCRKVLDDAWPKFQKLIKHRTTYDLGSDMRKMDFSVSSKLFVSILRTMTTVVEHVPLREGIDWSIAIELFPLLQETQSDIVQQTAVRFFQVLRSADNAEIVLLLERGLSNDGRVPDFLKLPGLHVTSFG